MNVKTKNTVSLVLTVILSLGFLYFGVIKLIGPELVLENFKRWGLPDMARYGIGGLEVAGAIGLWIPALRRLAALGLMGLMAGAIYTHLSNGEGFVAASQAILMFLLAGALFFLRKK